MKRIRNISLVLGVTCLVVPAHFAEASAHTWDIREVFSNADGTIQFVEMREMNGTSGETGLGGRKVVSMATGNEFTFPANLVGPTNSRNILLATAGFAALPGAPTPDYIIVDGFFDTSGDTLSYHVYDSWTFGAVPTDCINSLNDGSGVAENTPTNYDGQGGAVDCAGPGCPADITASDGGPPDGQIDVFDLLELLANWNTNGRGANIAPPNDIVDVFDLLELLANWDMCP